jgi:aminomethyltransferase
MTALKRTPLFDQHAALGARLIDFGGWELPVQYSSARAEHEAVRTSVGIFDVSHMGEVWVRGPGAVAGLDQLVTNSVAHLADGRACYAGLLNESGGFLDDLIVYRFSDEEIFICLNAGNAERDIAWIRRHLGAHLAIEDGCDDYAQVAVQGPEAVALVDDLAAGGLAALAPFSMTYTAIAGVDAIIAARTGYTGEDGFELYLPRAGAAAVWRALVSAGALPCGLGARDSLRLEMKYALYGNDIDETVNPIEAGLGWICKDKIKDFIGVEAVRRCRAEGPSRKLVGMVLEGRRVARHGASVYAADGSKIGSVTSGAFSPSLHQSIALALIARPHAGVGTELVVDIRGKEHRATVVKTPFYCAKRSQA